MLSSICLPIPWPGGLFFSKNVVIILGVVVLVRWFGAGNNDPRETQRKTSLEILQERYARGEIEREEYEQKRCDLE